MAPPLTDEDYLRVQLATKRESYSHQNWGHDVIRAFARADVITNNDAQKDIKPRTTAYRLKEIRARLRRNRSLAAAKTQEVSA